MDKNKPQPTNTINLGQMPGRYSSQTVKEESPGAPYLNHGTPSLVGMDSPDDSKLGSEKERPTK